MHTIHKTLRISQRLSFPLLFTVILASGCSRSDDVGSHFQKGLAAFENSNFAEATGHFSNVVNAFPKHIQALNFLGVSQLNEGRVRDALRNLETAVKLDADYGAAHYNLGTLFLERGQTEKAITHLRLATRDNLAPAQAQYYLGIAYMKLSAWSQSEQAFTKFLESDPTSSDTLNNLGIVIARQNRFHQAKRYFERCLGSDPSYDVASLNLAVLTERYLDQPKEALIHYKNYLAIASDSSHTMTVESRVEKLSKRFPLQTIRATNTRTQSQVTRDSKSPTNDNKPSLPPLASVTFLMAKNDQTDQAKPDTPSQGTHPSTNEKRRVPIEQRELKQGDRARATAMVNSAFLQQQLGNLPSAIVDYNRAILTDPSFALAYYNLAIAYETSGVAESALENYELSLMADSNYSSARFNYALLLSAVGYTNDSLAQYKILLKANPTDPAALLSAGMLCSKNRSTMEQARSYFETYLKHYPDSEQAREVRIWLYQNRIKEKDSTK